MIQNNSIWWFLLSILTSMFVLFLTLAILPLELDIIIGLRKYRATILVVDKIESGMAPSGPQPSYVTGLIEGKRKSLGIGFNSPRDMYNVYYRPDRRRLLHRGNDDLDVPEFWPQFWRFLKVVIAPYVIYGFILRRGIAYYRSPNGAEFRDIISGRYKKKNEE